MAGKFHFERSASKWPRLVICAGSNRMSRGLPDKETPEALFGTQAHDYASAIIKEQKELLLSLPLDDDPVRRSTQIAYAEDFAYTVKHAAAGGMLLSEVPVPIATYTAEKDATGDADAIVLTLAPDLGPMVYQLAVYDFKTGHHRVEPTSWQLKGYAFGAFDMLLIGLPAGATIGRVKLVIHQPPHGPPREYVYPSMDAFQADRKKIRTFMGQVIAADRAPDADVVYHLKPTTEGCRYCPAARALVCPAHAAWVRQFVECVTTTDSPPDVPAATMAQLDEWYASIAPIEQWIKYVKAEMFDRVSRGMPSTAAKSIQGRDGNRGYTDANAVYRVLVQAGLGNGEILKAPEVLPPAQLEEHAKKESRAKGEAPGMLPLWWHNVQPFIDRAPGKLSIAPIDDPAPAVSVTPRLQFADLTIGDKPATVAPAKVLPADGSDLF